MCHYSSKKAFVRLKTQIVIITPRQKNSTFKVQCRFCCLVAPCSHQGRGRKPENYSVRKCREKEHFRKLPTSLTLIIVFFLLHSIPDMALIDMSLHDRLDFYSRSYSRGSPWETFANGQRFLSQIYNQHLRLCCCQT